MDQERPSLSASEVATVFPRWRSGSDIHQSTRGLLSLGSRPTVRLVGFLCILRTIRKRGVLPPIGNKFPKFSRRYCCCWAFNSSKMLAFRSHHPCRTKKTHMAQSIQCTHCGAVMKTANPIAPGKKVKCPKCGQPFVVQEEEEEKKPAAKEEAPGAADETGNDDLDFSDKPKAKKNGKASDDDDGDDGKKKKPAKKKGKGLLIGLLLGGTLLLCCCCTGGGGGTGYWVWSKATPAFVGKWESKLREPDGSPEITLMIIENSKGVYIRGKGAPQDFKWRTIDSKTVEFDLEDPTKKKTFWTGDSRPNFTYTVEGNSLTLVTTDRKIPNVFQKIGEKDGKK
jgi:uncharacterized Zn finger protein (UPF0148 family)